ncbi:MAG: hypothetical protein EOP58_03595 [Sphingomonadales bacterium]|nr:MAG: hypothetical protein EOP58_03595 [Sphingomonadales bacterium]
MVVLRLAALVAALTLAGQAHAQAGNPGPAPAPSVAPPPPPEFRGPDERVTDFNRMRDDVSRRTAGPTRSLDPIPASPEDVTPGSDVRDSRGVVIGKIETASMGFAVVASPIGRVEVDLASFGKNNKGLMINMTKTKFEAIVAGGKPKK